ncbi:MAG: ribonuclease H-like domain-containing protein [Saprospirales bacterium]|nr:ribonuclease H-like domain-containing protein [Saprospirales bacterium]MBK8920816.1 ribonuclease H-like domain-containing protein [Saprospirales bacterium]
MSPFDTFDLYNILFLDIETVPGVPEFEELNEEMQELWAIKARAFLRKPEEELEFDELAETFNTRAGIYAEFGKIVCISVGFLTRQAGSAEPLLRLKSFTNHLEANLLEDFLELLEKHFNHPDKFALCGHNIKEFDIPYICRRMLVNQLPFPRMLDIAGRKPWETKHLLDTMELWKFGDIKNYTSLRLLAAVFGFPSPKDDMDGSDVAGVYWQERDLDRIAAYCEKDVLATVQLFLKMKRQNLLREDQIVIVR